MNDPIFSRDGKYIATYFEVPRPRGIKGGPPDATVQVAIWDVAKSKLLRLLPQTDGLSSMDFSKEGIFTASPIGVIRHWRLPSGDVDKTLENPDGGNSVLALKALPDGKSVVVAGKNIVIWDIAAGTFKRIDVQDKKAEKAIIKTVVTGGLGLPDGGEKLFALFASFRLVCLELPSGKEIRSASRQAIAEAWAIGSTGKLIATNAVTKGRGGRITLWDAKTLEEITTFDAFLENGRGHIAQIAFAKNDKYLIAAGEINPQAESYVRIWDLSSGRQVCAVQLDSTGGPSFALSPDGNHLAVSTQSATLKIYEWNTLVDRK
jgi:WD40 repeat protein